MQLDPPATQRPLPIWVGGGEKSVARAARWANCLMPSPTYPDDLKRMRDALDEASARAGRQVQLALTTYVAITSNRSPNNELSTLMTAALGPVPGLKPSKSSPDRDPRVIQGSPEQCAEQLTELFDAGLDYLVADFHLHGLKDDNYARDQMSMLAEEVLPAL